MDCHACHSVHELSKKAGERNLSVFLCETTHLHQKNRSQQSCAGNINLHKSKQSELIDMSRGANRVRVDNRKHLDHFIIILQLYHSVMTTGHSY